MAFKSFPPPGIVQWGIELAKHLGQLVDPIYGGINTWVSTPALGPDGFPLSTDHKGFTGINLSTQTLEYWTGSEWLVLSGGSDPIPNNFQLAFSDSDLNNGILLVPHNLGVRHPQVSVWDDTDEKLIPDRIKSLGLSDLEIHLTSFTPLTGGSWMVYVSV